MTLRWTLSLALAGALGGAAPLPAQDSVDAGVQVTLEEAIRRAIDVQPLMVQARGDGANADAQRRAALGAFVPTLILSSSTFRQNTPSIINGFPVSSGAFQFNSAATVRWDLFAGMRRLARYRNASATQDAADAGLVNQRFQVTLATKRMFYDALAREDLVRVAEAQVRRARQQLQISVEKLRAGSATRSDSLRSTVDHGNARISLLQAQAALATAQANLGRQVGLDGPVRAVPDTALSAFPDTVGLRGAADASAPSVAQAESKARAAAATVWDVRSLYWPTLSASLRTSSQGLTQPWAGFDSNRNQNSLTLQLDWTVFNGFARERDITDRGVTRDNLRAQARDERRRVSAALTEQLAALTTSHAKIDISRANVAAATEDLRVQQERYRVGAATILDLLTSQAALTQAEQGLVQARFDYLIARAQVEALVGRAL